MVLVPLSAMTGIAPPTDAQLSAFHAANGKAYMAYYDPIKSEAGKIIGILAIGYVYAWAKGALEWE